MKRIFMMLLCLAVMFMSAPSIAKADGGVISIGELMVHFIDVGQGDACIIELPDDRTMLIDAGENKKAVRTKLDEYITDNIKDDDGNVIEYFDYVVMTHSDSDHIGSMAYILENYHAKVVYRPNQQCVYSKSDVECVDPALSGELERDCFWGETHGSKSTATYHNALEAAYKYSDEVIVTNPYDDTQNTITSTNEEEYEINFYSPLSPDYKDNNSYSPIIVIEYRGKKIVVSGDAEKENEEEFVIAAKGGLGRYAVFDENFCADVIKLGHHGSSTSSSEDYLEVMTTPQGVKEVFVVISCGEGNSYGHPHKEVLERLDRMGFSDDKILRTDEVGDIGIRIDEVDGRARIAYLKDGDITEGKDKDTLDPSEPGQTEPGQTEPGQTEPGQTENEMTLKERFDALPLYWKIAIIAIVILIVIAVLYLIFGRRKKRRRRRR